MAPHVTRRRHTPPPKHGGQAYEGKRSTSEPSIKIEMNSSPRIRREASMRNKGRPRLRRSASSQMVLDMMAKVPMRGRRRSRREEQKKDPYEGLSKIEKRRLKYQRAKIRAEKARVKLVRKLSTKSLTTSRRKTAEIYYHPYTQVIVALAILGNFGVSILEAQIGTNRRKREEFGILAWIFFFVFGIELFVNMYSSINLKTFFGDAWNIFDTIVVAVSLIEVAVQTGSGIYVFLRLLRAFRVFRLFKRVKSLNNVVTGIISAIPGMTEDLIILFISMSIFALVAVQNFRNLPCSPENSFHSTGGPGQCIDFQNDQSSLSVEYTINNASIVSFPILECSKKSSPGVGVTQECRSKVTFGHEYFGNFAKALYTLFQILIGDSWSELIGRPLLEESPWTALFLIFHILIHGFLLLNVVIAVLLDKMVLNDNQTEDAATRRAKETEGLHRSMNHGAGSPAKTNQPQHHTDLFRFDRLFSQPDNWDYHHVFRDELPRSSFSSHVTGSFSVIQEEDDAQNCYQQKQQASPLSSGSAHSLAGQSALDQIIRPELSEFSQKLRDLDHKMLILNKSLMHLVGHCGHRHPEENDAHAHTENNSIICPISTTATPVGRACLPLSTKDAPPTQESTSPADLARISEASSLATHRIQSFHDETHYGGAADFAPQQKKCNSPIRASFAEDTKSIDMDSPQLQMRSITTTTRRQQPGYDDFTLTSVQSPPLFRRRASSSSTSPLPHSTIRDSPLLVEEDEEEEKQDKSYNEYLETSPTGSSSPNTSFAAKLFPAPNDHSRKNDDNDKNDKVLKC